MPYDVNVKATNAGKMEVDYNVQASPTKAELTAAEIAAARERGSIVDYVKGLKEQDGSRPVAQEEVPFPRAWSSSPNGIA